MAIEVVRDEQQNRPQFVCPSCKQVIVVDMNSYQVDATKPILSNCPYCGVGIFSCVILLAALELKHLQGMIAQAVNAVGPSVARRNILIDNQKLGIPQ